jgi:hypothetical protein
MYSKSITKFITLQLIYQVKVQSCHYRTLNSPAVIVQVDVRKSKYDNITALVVP